MLLTNCVLECLACLERRNLHRWDGDLLRRIAWVYTRASLALADTVRAETGDRNVVALLELLCNSADKSLESVGGSALGDACSIRNRSNQILLGHGSWGEEVSMAVIVRSSLARASQNTLAKFMRT